ncbi:GGDEF domain-containing protein [Marinimicrobium alkaliphilum]|uniref:GGDEF domain-containing protein n=1 Tax=Marinimicrobium alkaliphilum TaxID=2202654 RepID=UPI000DBA54FB|nr:GGDEF domain-containing protein [Marinimicrobium alkaliphilum]
MYERLKNDFRLSIMTLMATCATLGITPFALWRFVRGDWLVGFADSIIVTLIVGSVVYAWRTGNTRGPGLVIGITNCVGGTTVALVVGDATLFWLFPAFITCFFLTSAAVAVLLTLGSLTTLALFGDAYTDTQQMLTFSTTALVVSACAYVFARRNESQRAQLETLASMDPLTGVRNRRSLDEAVTAIMGEEHSDMSTGLVLIDLDHFKRVNDLHGHSTGDMVLRDFVGLLKSNIRRTDQLFRFGGEEFVLMLPDVNEERLRAALEHLLGVVRNSLEGPAGKITASFGAAILRPGESEKTWFNRADEALYAAKAQGRDRIVIAE